MQIEIPNKTPLELEVAKVTSTPAVISTAVEYHRAGEMLHGIRELDDKIVATFEPIRKSVKASLDTVTKTIADLRAPLAQMRKQIEFARDAFELEEERQRKEIELAALRAAEEVAGLDVDILDSLGLGDPSDFSAPSAMSMPVLPRLAKSPGISQRLAYEAEVVNLRDLVVAVYEGRAPLEYLQANQVSLNAIMRATRGRAMVPGVKANKRNVTSVLSNR